MTYIHVKLTLFIFYLFRLYKTHVKKEKEVKQKRFLEDKKKNQNKIYKCAKNRIK